MIQEDQEWPCMSPNSGPMLDHMLILSTAGPVFRVLAAYIGCTGTHLGTFRVSAAIQEQICFSF